MTSSFELITRKILICFFIRVINSSGRRKKEYFELLTLMKKVKKKFRVINSDGRKEKKNFELLTLVEERKKKISELLTRNFFFPSFHSS